MTGEQRHVVLKVGGMTCGGCARAVTRVIERKDPAATVTVDLATGRVDAHTQIEADILAAAVSAAGYEATVAS
jgi:copper chaperone